MIDQLEENKSIKYCYDIGNYVKFREFIKAMQVKLKFVMVKTFIIDMINT